ncbi:MAG: choice-of-anchor Q domain-containing protein, partial [Chloroflexota bacterium]
QVDYPPYIQDVLTDAALADQRLTDGEQVDVPITTFTLPFSRVMAEIGAGSVTNTSNYVLVNAGADSIINTTTCVNPAGDDSFVTINSIDYDTTSRVVTVVVNGGVGLPVGTYQLRVCSTLTDILGTGLDGNLDGIGGDDFELDFEVFPQQSGSDLVVNNYTTEFDGYCGVLHCTLPDAVAVANAQAGVNTITFDYENPLTGRNIGASNNVLSFAITDDLTIQGVPGVGVYANYSVASGVSFTLRDLLLGTYSSVSNDSGGTFTATNITRNSNLGRFLSNAGTAYIYDSIIGGNAVTEGGVIYNTGTLTLDNAYIVGGDVRERGAGIYNTGSLTIANSTFRNNEVSDGRGNSDAGGGAIYTANGTVDIRNTTFSQNEGGIGAAIRVDSGDVMLNNVTLINNTSNDDPYSDHIYVMPAGTLTIQNSILVGGNVQLEGSDCQGAVTSLGHNIIGEIGDDCTLTLQTSDILLTDYPSLNGDPLLDAIETTYNGIAPVAIPLPGSPANDGGNPATCEVTDQHGNSRTDGICDIGAYESNYMPTVMSVTFNGVALEATLERRVFEDEATEIGVQFSVPFLNPAGDTQVVDASRENAYRLVFA